MENIDGGHAVGAGARQLGRQVTTGARNVPADIARPQSTAWPAPITDGARANVTWADGRGPYAAASHATASHAATAQPTPRATTPRATKPTAAPLGARHAAMMIGVALAIAFAFDRLVIAPAFHALTVTAAGTDPFPPYVAFWLVCLVAFRLPFHAQAADRPAAQRLASAVTAAADVLVGAWLIMFDIGPTYATHDANGSYATLVMLAMPALTMLHAQVTIGMFDLFRPRRVIALWFAGWFAQPFAHLGHLPELCRAIMGTRGGGPDPVGNAIARRETRQRVVLAIVVAAPVVLVMGALLASADQVFAYAIEEAVGHVEIGPLVGHAIAVAALAALCCSFLLAMQERCDDAARVDAAGMAGVSPATKPIRGKDYGRRPLDPLVVGVVLGALLALYAAFCLVQFTFLFAGAGLPAGYTYSYYARHGFFQLLAVALIDFAAFGVALTYAPRRRALDLMLAGLLAATGVMLASATVRLTMYVRAYGLTWLRFASLAFIGLLAAVLALALVKLVAERTGRNGRAAVAPAAPRADAHPRARIPMIAVCFAMFLVWFVALGFANPGAIIDGWNAAHGFAYAPWVNYA